MTIGNTKCCSAQLSLSLSLLQATRPDDIPWTHMFITIQQQTNQAKQKRKTNKADTTIKGGIGNFTRWRSAHDADSCKNKS